MNRSRMDSGWRGSEWPEHLQLPDWDSINSSMTSRKPRESFSTFESDNSFSAEGFHREAASDFWSRHTNAVERLLSAVSRRDEPSTSVRSTRDQGDVQSVSAAERAAARASRGSEPTGESGHGIRVGASISDGQDRNSRFLSTPEGYSGGDEAGSYVFETLPSPNGAERDDNPLVALARALGVEEFPSSRPYAAIPQDNFTRHTPAAGRHEMEIDSLGTHSTSHSDPSTPITAAVQPTMTDRHSGQGTAAAAASTAASDMPSTSLPSLHYLERSRIPVPQQRQSAEFVSPRRHRRAEEAIHSDNPNPKRRSGSSERGEKGGGIRQEEEPHIETETKLEPSNSQQAQCGESKGQELAEPNPGLSDDPRLREVWRREWYKRAVLNVQAELSAARMNAAEEAREEIARFKEQVRKCTVLLQEEFP